MRFVPEVKYVSGSNLEGVYNPRVDSARKYAEQFYEYIRKALEQGKYVSCEKSLVLQTAQADEHYQSAKNKGLVLLEAIKTALRYAYDLMADSFKSYFRTMLVLDFPFTYSFTICSLNSAVNVRFP
ncbi:hypothetical protein AML91_11840 [Paenibacillus jilunlii]|nr:hypothetical protein AML91_11840 [Paenibacillus jilunlii]